MIPTSPPRLQTAEAAPPGQRPRPALGRLASTALRTRFGLARRWGWVRLAAAVVDPFIYAGVIYFLLAGVFGRAGFERYVFLVVGLAAFRWTLGCVLDGVNYRPLRERLAECVSRPGAAALCSVAAPPTAVMLLSLSLAVGLVLAGRGGGAQLSALPWLALVLAVQGAWNLAAVLAVDRLKRAGLGAVETAVVLFAGILWLLSPTLYTFSDLPATASLVFTTLNPVSHLLAAYYNATWYGVAPSLDVLPVAGVAGLALLVALAWPRRRRQAPLLAVEGNPLLVVADAADPPPALVAALDREARRYRPWSGRLQGYSGGDLVELMIAAGGGAVPAAVERVRAESRLGRLFDDQLAIYPAWGLAQLGYAFAITSPAPALVLDGVLDGADPMFAAQAWARIAAESAAGRRIVVVTYHLLNPPAATGGRFVAVRGEILLREGAIGAELAALYEDVLEIGGLPDPDDDQ